MKPLLIHITFKTKSGTYTCEVVSNSKEKTEVEANETTLNRCFRNKLEGFKKELVMNPLTNLPFVVSVKFIKELGI